MYSHAFVPAQDILPSASEAILSCGMASSSWNQEQPAWLQRYHAKMQSAAEQPAASDSDDDAAGNLSHVSPEEASARLYEYLVSLKEHGKLSARDVCTICFWARAANMIGQACTLAVSPARTGGNQSKHFDRITGVSEIMSGDTLDSIMVPGYDRATLGRSKQPYAATLAHDVIATEVLETRGFWEKFDSLRQSGHFGKLYDNHPDVLREPETKFIPFALYLDAVAIQSHNRDAGLGVWLENMVTKYRHLLLVHRKRHKCRCGCRGWCSYYILLAHVAWQLAALRRGTHPSKRFDLTQWPSGRHRDLAGQSLGFKCLCILLRGDWMEFSTSLGFCSWAHKTHPCFECVAELLNISVVPTIDHVPWPLKTPELYDRSCTDCESLIHLKSRSKFTKFMASIEYNRSKGEYSKGRMVIANWAEFGFVKNIHLRLEPSASLLDVGDLDQYLEDFPRDGVQVSLWDPTKEAGFHHRCPLFSQETGLTKDAIGVDELHVLFIGLFPLFIGYALWAIVECDGLSAGDGQNLEDTHALRGLHLRHAYFKWCKDEADKGNKKLNVYQEFDLKKLGLREQPNLSAKGGQAGTLLFFTVAMLKICHSRLRAGGPLLEAGQSLLRYITITRRAGRNLSGVQHIELCQACVDFLCVRTLAGIRFIPKMHLYVHLVFDSARKGNPKSVTSTWEDESLNHEYSCVAQCAHPLVWSKRILATFSKYGGPGGKFASTKRAKH